MARTTINTQMFEDIGLDVVSHVEDRLIGYPGLGLRVVSVEKCDDGSIILWCESRLFQGRSIPVSLQKRLQAMVKKAIDSGGG